MDEGAPGDREPAAQEEMGQQEEEEGEFQMGSEPTQEATEAVQDEAEEGDREDEGDAEPDTEASDTEGEPFSQQKTKRAKRAENAQEKLVKLANASARLPYDFLPELEPLYSNRLWKTIPDNDPLRSDNGPLRRGNRPNANGQFAGTPFPFLEVLGPFTLFVAGKLNKEANFGKYLGGEKGVCNWR